MSRIRFGIPEQVRVTITVYDILGRKVKTLMDKRLEPGYHEIVWNSKDNLGNNVSSGMYLYAIQSGDFVAVKKMVLLR
ncbi:MAG: T9SS type A sorting domain-containing protein [Candidatus Marinimicrobia bacterium]|nr:T9SS type A sorting domain-containing protein [Candidatus Neomarinimicrobiota bacterium]